MVPVRRNRREHGQALVEFLIVLPVLLLLILGLVAIGQLLLANYTVNQAARAAAHQAAIAGGAPDAAYLAAENVLNAGVGTSYREATISVACERTPCRRYDAITVQVAYAGAFWTPLPGFERFSVNASATRAAERDQQ
ncbi:MAG: pilus assembly protein [Oscillochloris sp.]|nr:pilus assembly protein [Oscillochloris sp.]